MNNECYEDDEENKTANYRRIKNLVKDLIKKEMYQE